MSKPSVDGEMIERLRALAAQHGDLRNFPVDVDGERFWIKRYDRDDRAIYKFLHRLVALLPLPAALRPSPAVKARDAVARELRKTGQFAEAGFPTPEIVLSDDRMIVSRDCGTMVDMQAIAERQSGNGDAHDRLLCNCVTALCRAHVHGLVHGRPHPRDMIIGPGGAIGFMDFEEEPEAVMPVETAQARDCWLLFLVVSDMMAEPQNAKAAFQAYVERAPVQVTGELKKLVRFWHRLLRPAQLLGGRRFGSDLRRILKADEILTRGLAAK